MKIAVNARELLKGRMETTRKMSFTSFLIEHTILHSFLRIM